MMVSQESPDVPASAAALVCQSAVQLIRARRKAGVAGGDVPLAVERLLSVVGHALATDPESVPTTIRDAAVELAARLVQRYSVPVPRDAVGGDESPERARSTSRGADGTSRRSVVPFGKSMRLGRMG
jgi:hypothetical protein